MIQANGCVAQTDYDAAGRIEAVRNLKSDDSVISIFTYSYDDAGNRTGVQEANGDRVTWSYDGASQLTREWRSGANLYDLTYTYDGAGNRILGKDSGNLVTYSYDAANELEWVHRSSPSTARVTYSYDANGNLALIDTMASLTTYTWDVEDRVAQVAPQGGTTNLMVYDGDGKRRVYTDSVMVRTFLWDGENIIRQTLRDYTYNPQAYGELISMGAEEEASYCYHYDALGSTDRVTAANESVVNQYLYRAFGEQTNVIAEGISNRFTWVGRLGYYREPDLNTYWLRARVYEPARGRFTSRDPARDETNLYRWPGNSPMVIGDPSGLWGWDPHYVTEWWASWVCDEEWSCRTHVLEPRPKWELVNDHPWCGECTADTDVERSLSRCRVDFEFRSRVTGKKRTIRRPGKCTRRTIAENLPLRRMCIQTCHSRHKLRGIVRIAGLVISVGSAASAVAGECAIENAAALGDIALTGGQAAVAGTEEGCARGRLGECLEECRNKFPVSGGTAGPSEASSPSQTGTTAPDTARKKPPAAPLWPPGYRRRSQWGNPLDQFHM